MDQIFNTSCFVVLTAAGDWSLILSDIALPVHFLCNSSTGDTGPWQRHLSIGEGATSPAPVRGPKDSLQPGTPRAAPTLWSSVGVGAPTPGGTCPVAYHCTSWKHEGGSGLGWDPLFVLLHPLAALWELCFSPSPSQIHLEGPYCPLIGGICTKVGMLGSQTAGSSC